MFKNFINSVLILVLSIIISCNKDVSKIIDNKAATFIIYTFDEYGTPSGSGSGFFIGEDGVGLTNYHVLDGSTKAIIITSDSSKHVIDKILIADKDKDIVKFKVKSEKNKKFETLQLANKEPSQADRTYCISNPRALECSFSEGIISAVRSDKKHGKVVQFTAPISPGSSGAPVMNEDGEVIAIATYQRRDGQNLNFGVYLSDEVLNNIKDDNFSKKNTKFIKKDKFIIINKKADNDPFSILNAIEFGDEFTTLYFSYTRMNLTPSIDDKWGFWLNLNQGEKGFHITDLDTKKQYYIISSSVGEDIEHQTNVPLASTLYYKVYLPKISSQLKSFSVSERDDSRSSKWNEIKLSESNNFSNFNIENYQLTYALGALSEKDYSAAQSRFLEVLNNDPIDLIALNSLGVIAFVNDNYSDATNYFDNAIETNPLVEESYVNRHFLKLRQKDVKAALEDISKAISISPEESNYYLYREKIYLYLGDKENAMKDFYKADETWAKDYNRKRLGNGYNDMSLYDYLLKVRFN